MRDQSMPSEDCPRAHATRASRAAWRTAAVAPDAHAELVRTAKLLEDHFRDMQDLEFTIQRGKLFMLQTRTGKRTGKAMVKVAVDLVAEGKLQPDEAVQRIDPAKLVPRPLFSGSLLHQTYGLKNAVFRREI